MIMTSQAACEYFHISKCENSAHRQDRATIYSANVHNEQVPSEGRDVAPETALEQSSKFAPRARGFTLPLLITIGFH